LAFGFWLLAFGTWLLDFGTWLLTNSQQPKANNSQRPTTFPLNPFMSRFFYLLNNFLEMKQLLILLTFIVPIVLNAQKANPYVGVSLGTFARSQHFKSNSFNVSIDYRYTYTNKHLGIGFISSFDFFPKFKYLDETTELFFTNIGAEFFILSKDNSGFLIGGAIEYPLNIDDGFSRKSQTKTMRLLPSFNIGISEKKFTILLSYKHYDYTNS